MNTSSLFETLRQTVTAAQVAEHAGLRLERRGTRSWTRCPLHGEKTASMCFFEDGRFYCFGCNQGGDAVALYAAMHGLSMGIAAQSLAEQHGIVSWEEDAPPVNTWEIRRQLDRFEAERWARYCDIAADAQAEMTRLGQSPEAWEDQAFIDAMCTKSTAEMELEQMQLMRWEDWLDLYYKECAHSCE